MCRIFAVRSQVELPLYRFLLTGDNSFAVQSLEHPDGWGLAYFAGSEPRLVKSMKPAICDPLFEEVSFDVNSKTVLAHIRRATAGAVSKENCHPFQHGPWTFVHNGHIHGFEEIRPQLIEHVSSDLKPLIRGSTDSEVYFFMLLSRMVDRGLALHEQPDRRVVRDCLAETVATIHALSDARPNRVDELPSWLSCIVTNGPLMFGLSAGKHLSVRRVDDNPDEPYVMFSSEAIAAKGFLPMSGSWIELEENELAVIDESIAIERMALFPASTRAA